MGLGIAATLTQFMNLEAFFYVIGYARVQASVFAKEYIYKPHTIRISECSGRWICTTDLQVMGLASYCCSIPVLTYYHIDCKKTN